MCPPFFFYSDLFSSRPTDELTQDKLLNSIEVTLAATAADSCEGLLTFDECLSALSGIKSGKSPGFDGLPKEFYLTSSDVTSSRSLTFLSNVVLCPTPNVWE